MIVVVSRSSSREADAVRAALGERPRHRPDRGSAYLRPGRLRQRPGERSHPAPERRPRATDDDTATAVRVRRREATDARPKRRDRRAGRAARPPRRRMVQGARTAAEPGSRLFTVGGAVGKPGVYEAELGSRLADLIAAAGGLTRPAAGVPDRRLLRRVDRRPRRRCADPRRRVARRTRRLPRRRRRLALPDHACGICESARVARYLASESAGQCGPCVHGLSAIAERLEQDGTPKRRRRPSAPSPLGGRGHRPRRLPPSRRRSALRPLRTPGLRAGTRSPRPAPLHPRNPPGPPAAGAPWVSGSLGVDRARTRCPRARSTAARGSV